MRTSYRPKLRRIGLLGLAAACVTFAAGATTARADDDWRGHGWDKHWKKHHRERVIVVERPVPYYAERYYYAPPPPVVVYQEPAYVYRPAPVYVPAGDSFSFSLTLRN